jgi:Reverse transcriptase (RNA-dependent DNA polymerase)
VLSRLSASFGVCGTALLWFFSNLIGRSQTVSLGNFLSSMLNCSSDVAQGSVLGPILFSIYVSPVYHTVQLFTISHQQYAGDFLLYIALSSSQPHSCISHIQQCLLSRYSWFSINGLSLNVSKSNFILYSPALT